MKLLSSIALIFGLVPAKPSPKDKMDMACMMTAIAAVESTPNHVLGMAGERSRYQVSSRVWEAHSDQPFEVASLNDSAAQQEVRRVVRKHILWIRERLKNLHYPDQPYYIFLVYHAGYGRCLEKKVRTIDYNYANRANNVYEEITQ